MARSIKPSVYIDSRKTKRGFKTYRVRREVNGRELPSIACGTNHDLAKRVRDEWKNKLWHRRHRIPLDSDALSVAQFASKDRGQRETRVAASTARNDRIALDLFGQFYPGPLREVDRQTIQDFEAWLREQTWRRGKRGKERARQVNGILIILRALKAALRRALKDGHMDADPFFGYTMPPEEDVANPPDKAGARAIWERLPFKGRCALAVDLALGFRRGELYRITERSLQPPTADRAHWLVRVQKSKTRRGKVEFKTLALPAVALAALEAMRPWPADPSKPIFDMHETTLSHWVSAAGRASGLGRVRLHDMRHRWATELMERCRDEYALMDVGGWTTRAAVARYQHSTPARRDATLLVDVDLPPVLPANAFSEGARSREKH